MMSSTIACSSFVSTKCSFHQEQGMFLRSLKPLPQRRGLVTKLQDSKMYKTPLVIGMAKNNQNADKPLYNKKKESLNICCYSTTSDHHENGIVQEIKDQTSSFWARLSKQYDAFYRFSRPYTVIGTVVGIVSISLLPLQSMADLSPKFFMGLLKALVPMVLINFYMVGINQLSDVGIDKINKPDLPLASGEFSITHATAITGLSAIASFAMGFLFKSPPLLYAISTVFGLATAYSLHLPFLRWKNSAILTSVCIIGVRALVIPLAFFIHMQKYVLGRPAVITKPVMFAVAFMTIISTVIAVIKDIPDVDGDEAFGLQSLTTRIGKEKVFWAGVSTLLMAYGMAIAVGATSTLMSNKIISVLGHCALATHLLFRARSVELSKPASTLAFYLYVWKLLYAEYLLIPFVQ